MAPRPNSDAAVTARIALIPRPERETATALRDLIRAALPRAQESIKWGYPTYSGESNICSLNPAKGYVRLQFFRGAHLHDPHGLLEGTGKGMRHIKVRRRADVKKGRMTALLKAAEKLDRS